MKPKILFLRYGIGCIKNEIERNRLVKIILEEKNIEDEEIDRLFPNAVKRIKTIAKNRNPWSYEVIEEYWQIHHNRMIDRGLDGFEHHGDSQKDFCKVHLAEVKEVSGNHYVVKYSNIEKRVLNVILQGINIGERIYIHRGYAVKKA